MATTGPKPRAPADRVLSHVSYDRGCWVPSRLITTNGYAIVSVKRDGEWRSQMAHRAVYEALVGPIPDGMELDHLCRNPACCNPDHLEPVSSAENVRRGSAAAFWRDKTNCTHGHAFTPENTVVFNGSRQCRACNQRRRREWKQRFRERNGKWPR